ncbi:MAG: hypothetical protein FWD61_06955 [Phycisphaerales bacterium]|nr:hypothetical protein [Phycisphaerales bacterium]
MKIVNSFLLTRIIGLLVVVASFPACGKWFFSSGWTDVTTDRTEWGGYEPGQEYRLKTEVFLRKNGDGSSGGILVAPASLIAPNPNIKDNNPPPATVTEYRADPAKWPWYIDVIPAGTRIRVSHIRRWNTMTNSEITIFADIIDGDIRQNDVGIRGLSRRWRPPPSIILWEPNPLILDRVTP